MPAISSQSNSLAREGCAPWFWKRGVFILGGFFFLAGLAGIFLEGALERFFRYLVAVGFAGESSLGLAADLPRDSLMLGLAVFLTAAGYRLVDKEFLNDFLERREGLWQRIAARHKACFLLLSAACVVLLYHYSVNFFFIKDDFSHLLIVQRTRPWYKLFGVLLANISWRPMSLLIYRAAYNLFGLEPAGYHLIYFGLHIINTWLVYMLAQRLFQNKTLSLLSGVIFSTRFCLFYGVAISNTQDPIATLFALSALIWYGKGREKPVYYFLSLAALAGAFMSKELSVVVPPLLVLYELFFGWESPRLQKLPAALARLAPPVITLAAYFAVRSHTLLASENKGNRLRFEMATASKFINYPRFSFNGPLDPCAVLLVTLAAYFLFARLKKQPVGKFFNLSELKGIGMGVLWFFGTLSPVLLFGRTAKHYLYLPEAGFSLAVACVACAVHRRIRKGRPRGALLFTICFIFVTISYAAVLTNVKARGELGYIALGKSAESYIRDLKAMYPRLPAEVILYIVPRGADPELAGYFWNATHGGNALRVFYPESDLIIKIVEGPGFKRINLDRESITLYFDRDHIYRGQSPPGTAEGGGR